MSHRLLTELNHMMHLADLPLIDEKKSRGYYARKNDKRHDGNPHPNPFRHAKKRRGGKKQVYNEPDYNRQADEEHEEAEFQSDILKNDKNWRVHPKIGDALHRFSKDKGEFKSALEKSKIERAGNLGHNSNGGYSATPRHQDPEKYSRARKQNRAGKPIDRPIVLRHKQKGETTHHHQLAGNHRLTMGGKKTQVHFIDV